MPDTELLHLRDDIIDTQIEIQETQREAIEQTSRVQELGEARGDIVARQEAVRLHLRNLTTRTDQLPAIREEVEAAEGETAYLTGRTSDLERRAKQAQIELDEARARQLGDLIR